MTTVYIVRKAHTITFNFSLSSFNWICGCGGIGERWERRLWREERPERVAAVGEQRSCTDSKAHTGHRNRKTEKQHMRMWWNW